MSFYPQPDNYTCGPFSLKHAMNIFGVFKSDGLIIEKSGAKWWAGVDEVGLDRAARAFNFKLEEFRSDSEYKALVLLNKNLKKIIHVFYVLMTGNIGLQLLITQNRNMLLLTAVKIKCFIR